jgi:hypothetical protein
MDIPATVDVQRQVFKRLAVPIVAASVSKSTGRAAVTSACSGDEPTKRLTSTSGT